MAMIQSLQEARDELHVSYSQVFMYLGCSLKYKFLYVEGKPSERISINLPFGKAIHKCQERYYRALMVNKLETLKILQELFEDYISTALDNIKVPIIYKKATPDRSGTIAMGKSMLKAFYESVNLDGMKIVDVELALKARLYKDNGEATDMVLIGIIDLVLLNQNNELIAVDNKTAAKPYAQSTVDEDLQLSSYAYLLAANRFTFPTSPIKARFDVLRKLKKPKLEHYETVRTAQDRKRFANITSAVLSGIENKIFVPSKSWLCSDCQFINACEAW